MSEFVPISIPSSISRIYPKGDRRPRHFTILVCFPSNDFLFSAKHALRSDTPTALLDRNLASQLLDGGHRDRSKRHIFELCAYLGFPNDAFRNHQRRLGRGEREEGGGGCAHLDKLIRINVLLLGEAGLLEHVFEIFGPYARIRRDALQQLADGRLGESPRGVPRSFHEDIAQRVDLAHLELRAPIAAAAAVVAREGDSSGSLFDPQNFEDPVIPVLRGGPRGAAAEHDGARGETHALQESRGARHLLLLARRVPVQLLGHDVDHARERLERGLGAEEGEPQATRDHVCRRQRVLVTNCVSDFRLDDCTFRWVSVPRKRK